MLAAANPKNGSFTNGVQNLDFMSSILSRFDMIFFIRDPRDRTIDVNIAKHCISVHKSASLTNAPSTATTAEPMEINLTQFCKYCRENCKPLLSKEARDKLVSQYVIMRKSAAKGTIPVSVRQLEAIIRIGESLAKMQLKSEVSLEHVEEALRLFKVSTMHAVAITTNNTSSESIENNLDRYLVQGSSVSYANVLQHFKSMAYSDTEIRCAINNLIKCGDIVPLGDTLKRVK